MKRKTMALTYAQKLSFSQLVLQFMRDNEAALREKGFDTSHKAPALESSVAVAIQDDAKQETAKSEVVRATEKAVASLNTAYNEASSSVDLMVGVFGKTDPLSKRLRQLRDQMALEASRGRRTPA